MYRRGLFLAALALIGGCGLFTLRSPAQGGARWFEVTTERFVLRTDLDEAAALAAAREFEDAYLNLEQVAFPGNDHLAQRVNIVLFRSSREFHHFWPRDIAGLYFDRPPRAIERAPTMALYGSLQGDTRTVFLHELTHRLMAREYGWAPVWLNEGLADYFSTMQVADGRAILGVVPPGRGIDPNLMPSVQELVTADHEGFYGVWSDGYGAIHRARYYAGAYALVHLLRQGSDEQRRLFDTFVGAMNDGARANQAWNRTLGALPEGSLEGMYREHLDGWRDWDLFGTAVQPTAAPSFERVRAMIDPEVHLLWASLIDASGDGVKDVQEELDVAQAEAPSSPEVAYARGCFEAAQQHLGGARSLFEAALAREPDNPRYLHGVIMTRLLDADRSNALGGLLARLDSVATSADQMAEVAEYDSAIGDREGAMRHVEAAVAVDPGYSFPLTVRARIHFDAGEFGAAVADQERALALLPEDADARPLARSLAEYRQALSNGKATRE